MTGPVQSAASPGRSLYPILVVLAVIVGVVGSVALSLGSSSTPAAALATPTTPSGEASLLATSPGPTNATGTAAATLKATQKPTPAPTPAPTPNTDAAVVSFSVPTTVNCNDPSNPAPFAHLAWTVKNATGVQISLDYPAGLYATYSGRSGSADVPFSCSSAKHVYYVITTGGTTTATVHKTSIRAVPKIVSWSVENVADCSGAATSATLHVSWTLKYATGIDLYVDGTLYTDLAGATYTAYPFSVSCSSDHVIKIVTTAAYGPQAARSKTVTRVLA